MSFAVTNKYVYRCRATLSSKNPKLLFYCYQVLTVTTATTYLEKKSNTDWMLSEKGKYLRQTNFCAFKFAICLVWWGFYKQWKIDKN